MPGSPGIYQINVQVPSDAVNGDLAVAITSGTFTSASTLLTVQK
jgi:uncharacterized protein (TIGR03437 family)